MADKEFLHGELSAQILVEARKKGSALTEQQSVLNQAEAIVSELLKKGSAETGTAALEELRDFLKTAKNINTDLLGEEKDKLNKISEELPRN